VEADRTGGQRAQALIIALAAVFVVMLGTSVLAALGGALAHKGRLQRATDLAAVSAARAMRDDFELLFEPAFIDGRPNPRHLARTAYLARARDAALEAGRSVAIYSLPKLLARIRRTYDAEPGGDSYLAFFERLTSVDLLHIDDLGAEKRSDWVLEQLYALINERYEEERTVLITTNLPHDELEEQIGTRTVSRLSQMCDEVPLFGSDRRYGKAA